MFQYLKKIELLSSVLRDSLHDFWPAAGVSEVPVYCNELQVPSIRFHAVFILPEIVQVFSSYYYYYYY